MEINVKNFHPIGRDAESYRGNGLIESVTMTQISVSELIGRYNLLLEYVAANAPESDEHDLTPDEIDNLVTEAKLSEARADAWLAKNAPAPQTQPAQVAEDDR